MLPLVLFDHIVGEGFPPPMRVSDKGPLLALRLIGLSKSIGWIWIQMEQAAKSHSKMLYTYGLETFVVIL